MDVRCERQGKYGTSVPKINSSINLSDLSVFPTGGSMRAVYVTRYARLTMEAMYAVSQQKPLSRKTFLPPSPLYSRSYYAGSLGEK